MSSLFVPALVDLVAIVVLASLYFSRHQRRDLFLAYVALNVGVLSVTAALADAPVGAGLGLGLFGILSIIRLRSDSITQEEIAYYFVALALGLVAGLHPGPIYLAPALCALLVVVVYVVDHPALLSRTRRQLVTIDAAIADEDELRRHLAGRLGGDVRHLLVQELDFVRDLTIVDVRFRHQAGAQRDSIVQPATAIIGASPRDASTQPLVGAPVAMRNGHPGSALNDVGGLAGLRGLGPTAPPGPATGP